MECMPQKVKRKVLEGRIWQEREGKAETNPSIRVLVEEVIIQVTVTVPV